MSDTTPTNAITFDASKHEKRLRGCDYDEVNYDAHVAYKAWWQALPEEERSDLYEQHLAHVATEREARDIREKLESRFAGLRNAGIPQKDIDLIMSNVKLTETAAMKAAREFSSGTKAILVLLGPRGVGKTFAGSWLAACAEDHILGNRARYDGMRSIGDSSPIYARFIAATQLARTSMYDDKAMTALERVGLLVIDDLGVEYSDQKGSFLSLFDGIFNARYANKRRTVITTNLTAPALTSRYGERIVDRIRESGVLIGLDGASMRGRA